MGVIRPKYHQGTLRTKWKIQQCQGERDYFKIPNKDCDNCPGRSYCFTNRFRPFNIKVTGRVVVFADTFENAKEYAGKGYGWVMEKDGVDGFLIKVKIEGDQISMTMDLDHP